MNWDKKIEPFAPGVKIAIPGYEIVVPELSLGSLQELESDIKLLGLDETSADERTRIGLKVIVAALKRHYPEVQVEDVKTSFGLSDIRTALDAATNFKANPQTAAR